LLESELQFLEDVTASYAFLEYNFIMERIITFIGAGNMTRSLVAGLIQDKVPHQIRISDPDESQIQAIKNAWNSVADFTDNNQAVKDADVVVLAVKPQIMQLVCEGLADSLQPQKPLIVSIAAGITIDNLAQWLDADQLPIVRCMPNTPALVQSGMTGLYANTQVSETQHDLAESILRAVGSTLWLDNEDLINAVTAISGSGPAYYFLVMEAMQKAAIKMGLSVDQARLLVLQTAFGAAKLALESTDDAAILRKRVTSKGGTTEAALEKLMSGGLEKLFEEALNSAKDRSIELSKL